MYRRIQHCPYKIKLEPNAIPRILTAIRVKRVNGGGLLLVDDELTEGFESFEAEIAPMYCCPKFVIFPLESIIALSCIGHCQLRFCRPEEEDKSYHIDALKVLHDAKPSVTLDPVRSVHEALCLVQE